MSILPTPIYSFNAIPINIRSKCQEQHLCTRYTFTILNWGEAQCFSKVPSWGVWHSSSVLGTLVQSAGCKASTHGPLQASELRLRTKEKDRPYHLDSILFFPGDPSGLCWWLFLECSYFMNICWAVYLWFVHLLYISIKKI